MVKSLTAAEKSGRESRKLHVLGHEKSKNPKIDKDFSIDSLIRIIHFGGKISKKFLPNYGDNPLRNTCSKNERKLLHGLYHAVENPGVHCFDVKVYTAAKSGFRFAFSAKNNAES